MTNTPPPAGPSRGAPVGAGAGWGGQAPTGTNGNGASRRPEPVQDEWHTAADDGWRAASAAASTQPSETTQAGLPRRVPMAQLVPGGVDKSAASVQRRTPEAVRGLLSAYHRGVQRGRSQPKDEDSTNPEATPAGQRTSQGPAGSGQKEQER